MQKNPQKIWLFEKKAVTLQAFLGNCASEEQPDEI
jgi:hypothetical protein